MDYNTPKIADPAIDQCRDAEGPPDWLPAAKPGRRAGQRSAPHRADRAGGRINQKGVWDDFSVRMTNRFQFSSCDAPWLPTTDHRQQTLAVEFRDGLLTITELRPDGSPGNRIYAHHSVELVGAMAFVILPELPSRIRDGSFFPALGTVVIFEGVDGGGHRLRAVGTDINSQRCRGWIFDAWETRDCILGSESSPTKGDDNEP
jgi:hypothetical protein